MNWKKGKKTKINGISALKDQTCKEIERKRLNSLYIAIHVKPRHSSNPMLLEKKKQHKDLVLFFPKWEFRAEKTNGSFLSLTHRLNRERRNRKKKGILMIRSFFIFTKDHVVLRVQVERLPAEFRSRNQLAFAANLQIRIPIVLDVCECVSE
jgi:hypothetical protein